MKKNQHQPPDDAALRLRAEERLKRQRPAGGGQTPEVEATRLVHELQVHQIELEMQNEELRQARAETETLLAQYTDLYDSAPAGYFTLDREGAIQLVNSTGARLFGVERSRLVNRRFGLFVVEGDRRTFSDFLQKVFASHAKECCEVTLPQAGSQPRVLQIEGARSADGQECRAVVLDITENRHMTEGALMVLRNAMDGFWVVDMQGRFLEANEAYCRIIGYTRDELLAMKVSDIEAAESPEVTAAHLANIVRKGSDRFLTRHRRKDGAVLDVEVSANYLPLDDGRLFVFLRDITQRIQTQAELSKLSIAVNASSEAIFMTDMEGIIRFVNPAFQHLYGYAAAEVVGKTTPRILKSGMIPQAAYESFWNSLLSKRVLTGEIINKTRDGRLLTIESSTNSILNEQGQSIGFLAIQHDITERKQAEATLTESEVRYRGLFEANPHPMWVYDVETLAFLQVNDAAVAHYGYRRDEFLAMTIADIRATEDVARLLAYIAHVDKYAMDDASGLRHRKKDGTFIDVEITSHAIDHGGRRARVVLAHDITKRRGAEAALLVQSAALNAAANAIVITDRHGTIEWVNLAFTAVSGYSADDAIGRNLRELVKSGVHDQGFYKHMWDSILAGHVWHGEMTNRRKDGSLYPEDQTITPVKDARDEITHFVAIKRDRTEYNRLQAQFLQAQKMESVGLLAGGIAHDFNNLLTVINGMTEVISTNLSEGDPLLADLQHIQEAGKRAAALTRQLLAFSRKQILTPGVLNLSTLVAEIQGMLQRLIGEDIGLVVVPGKEVGNVRADRGQIEQVIMNLAINARDAMTNGGLLTIETRDVVLDEAFAAEHPSVQPGPHVMLAIGDTGVGMDDATRARIFEPFFTTKDPGTGTGLGLSTVYGIVKQSGGSIWAYSELGKGTTFEIYLPRVEAVALKSQPTPKVTSVHGTETVLIVEDEAAVRDMARRILQSAGYTVLSANNGQEALALLERHHGTVHLMLTDMVMPGMTGGDLSIQVKVIRPRTKVLYTSGYTDGTSLFHGLLDKATHFIGKPYTIAALTRKVREVLDS
jgi:two-component system cell cycle sensor histidine kinase/response regulator CckA